MAPLPHLSSHSDTPQPPQPPQPNFPFSFLLSSSLPLPSQNLTSRPSILDRAVPNAHQFLNDLTVAFSNNPFIRPFVSVRAQFRSFCQMHHRTTIKPTNLSKYGFGAVLPGDSVAGLVVANGVSNFLNIYNGILIARIVLTWFPNAPQFIVNPLSTLCDPYLNLFRGIIPPLGGIDLSPILAFLVLDAFTSTAAALPAELPSKEITLYNSKHDNITTTQKLWMKRLLFSKKSKKDGASN